MSDKTPLVIYHGNCQDGFTAAWACWKVNPDWEYYPAKHGDPPPDVTGRIVYMLDFSYKRPVILEMASKADFITILDHHKTAEADLVDLPANVSVTFDMKRSGAMLAWEHFHKYETVPWLVKYVQDRDLWTFLYEDTKPFTAALFAEEYDFGTWCLWSDKIQAYSAKWAIEQGNAILKKQAKDVAELCQNKFRYIIGGQEVWVVNIPYTLCSDAGNLLAKGEPFAASFYYDGEGYIFSLRSDDNGVDVSEIAKQYGGGGHAHAAGFKLKSPLVIIDPKKVGL